MNAALAAEAVRRRNAYSLLSAALRITKSTTACRRWLATYGASADDRTQLAADALDLLGQLEQAAKDL